MEELAADPTVGRAPAARPRGAAGRRLAAAAQHGDDRREPAAAHALPLLPRSDGGGVQQARARVRLRRGRPVPRGCTRSSAPASTASRCTPRTSAWRWSRSTPSCTSSGAGGERSVPLTEFYVVAGRATRRRERARARRADHRDRDAAAAGGRAVGLPEGPRPRLVRVRAHLGGGGAGDRGRHDRRGARRARRRRHHPVACARGRGGPAPARPASADVSRAAAEAAIQRPVHRSRHRVQGRARQADDRADPADDRGMPHDHYRDATRSSASGSTASTARSRSPAPRRTRPTSPSRTSRTRRWCAARSPPGRISRIDTARARGGARGADGHHAPQRAAARGRAR